MGRTMTTRGPFKKVVSRKLLVGLVVEKLECGHEVSITDGSRGKKRRCYATSCVADMKKRQAGPEFRPGIRVRVKRRRHLKPDLHGMECVIKESAPLGAWLVEYQPACLHGRVQYLQLDPGDMEIIEKLTREEKRILQAADKIEALRRSAHQRTITDQTKMIEQELRNCWAEIVAGGR